MPPAEVSLIVTTYQMPGHLQRALASIAAQRTGRRLEVIVADDGSRDETRQVVADYAQQVPFAVRFCTHPHADFRPAVCRNRAARLATADHLLFFDGDCLLAPDHVETHLRTYRPGTVTSGYCVRLDESASSAITLETVAGGEFIHLAPAAELRKLAALHRKAGWYNLLGHPAKPSLKSTDFSIARADFERVNGFDEQFRGWGCEDDDLGRRLIAAGVRPVSVLDRTRVYHLWHPPAPSKPGQWRQGANVAYLQRPIRLTRTLRGLVDRLPRELTIRLAGEPDDSPALAQLTSTHGWRLECDPDQRADIELLVAPGRGGWRGGGDCRVFAQLQHSARLPWPARRAHIVLSPSGLVGRRDQVRLRLSDAAGLWQALLVGRVFDPSVRTRITKVGRVENPSYDDITTRSAA
jgi:glycosyltransferase involved in cell wall biosynthesis